MQGSCPYKRGSLVRCVLVEAHPPRPGATTAAPLLALRAVPMALPACLELHAPVGAPHWPCVSRSSRLAATSWHLPAIFCHGARQLGSLPGPVAGSGPECPGVWKAFTWPSSHGGAPFCGTGFIHPPYNAPSSGLVGSQLCGPTRASPGQSRGPREPPALPSPALACRGVQLVGPTRFSPVRGPAGGPWRLHGPRVGPLCRR